MAEGPGAGGKLGAIIMMRPPSMNREEHLARAEARDAPWDVLIIGGGATGLGTAVDAAARGYRTLLLEQSDFGKGTSSRSTKLVHGGVRYLRQGNFSLVVEALRERGLLLRNARHLCRPCRFVIPGYRWWERGMYGIGLKAYDALARDLSLGKSQIISRRVVLDLLPTLSAEGLRGGVSYFDGQFDDSRLVVNLAQTAADLGATVLNYVRVEDLLLRSGHVNGVVAQELESGRSFEIRGRAIVNATGVFADAIRQMDNPTASAIIRPSQGVHVVVDGDFLPGDSALMIPRTDDGRVLFGVPWHDRILLGTTDTPVGDIRLEPRALQEEVEFLLRHARRYLTRPIEAGDVRSVFTGLRPLVSTEQNGDTASISRDHVLRISRSGLITITGGKWTTYRKMAEETVDRAIEVGSLDRRPSTTQSLPIRGSSESVPAEDADTLAIYGTDAPAVQSVIDSSPEAGERLHERLPYVRGEVRWAARNEMARTVDDVLSRRTRSLILDARASMEAAPLVASVLGDELGRDAEWQRRQVEEFKDIAAHYLISSGTARMHPEHARPNA